MKESPRFQQLFNEILMARQRVYEMFKPTPLEELPLGILDRRGLEMGAEARLYLKREDLSPIHSYKWRGAYNRMAALTEGEKKKGVVCASAGNHAQGVAVSAQKMGVRAKIYMPRSTPAMKQSAVRKFGGDMVDVILQGDHYSAAAREAVRQCGEQGGAFIHPYDDYLTMGGQGTLADEIVMSGKGPFDTAYLQIGGGGMAASAACWLKKYYPNIRIVGVEGVGQASMQAAVKQGRPVALEHVDVFSDGTAVEKAGELTFPLCRDLIDEYLTVTNEELCAAIQLIWEQIRCIPEPAGAMGLAGLMKDRENARGQRVLCIICGANLDFGQLSYVARHAGIGASRRRYYRFQIEEKGGSLLHLLELFEGINIIEMQYGKTHPAKAWPVIGLEGAPMEFQWLEERLEQAGLPFEDVTSEEDVEFRIIHYTSELFHLPYFFRIEFPERAGALRDFMRQVKDLANMCYFNYVYSGERIGRALLGFEFDNENSRGKFLQILGGCGMPSSEVAPNALQRMLG